MQTKRVVVGSTSVFSFVHNVLMLFTEITLEDFVSELRCPYEMILTAIEYMGSGFISVHATYPLIC